LSSEVRGGFQPKNRAERAPPAKKTPPYKIIFQLASTSYSSRAVENFQE